MKTEFGTCREERLKLLTHETQSLTHLSSLGARRARCGNGHHTLVNVIEKTNKTSGESATYPQPTKTKPTPKRAKIQIHDLTANSAANPRPPDMSAATTCSLAPPSPVKREQQKATYTR